MGLIKKDFVLKEYGNLVLPNAYAFITDCVTNRATGYATIGIFLSRESALNGAKPFTTVNVEFTVDRNENDRKTAYKQAKEPIFVGQRWTDEKTLENVYKDSIFKDWEDDIEED